MIHPMKYRSFGELAEFRNGINFTASSRAGSDLAVIGVGDFQRNEKLTDFGNLETISRPRGLEEASLLRDGDLVFVRSNGSKDLVGRCMVLSGVDRPVSHSGFTIRARLTSNEVSPDWIGYFFAAGLAKREILRQGGGTNISNLSQAVLQELPIPVPPTAYQERVLRVANGLSKTVRLLEAEVLAKRKRKFGLMQRLLTGQTRIAEFRDGKWATFPLGRLFSERLEANRSDLPLLSVTANQGVIPRDDLDKRDTSNPDKSKYKRVAVGDIVYNTMRMWQGVSALSALEGIVSPAYTVAVPSDPAFGSFARHMFKYAPVVHLFYRHSQGLVDDTLNLKFDRFAKIKLTIPSEPAEQRRIAEILDLCDSELDLLQARIEQIKLRKQSLVSALLSDAAARMS